MNYFLTLAVILFVYMNFWFVLSLIKKRNDIADVAWGMGFILLSWISIFISENYSLRGILIAVLVSIWGFRLAIHIHERNKNKTEDYRYLAWRKEWGKWFYIRSYLQVYILQGIFLYMIAIPILIINSSMQRNFGLFDLIGISIWILGFYFEVVGDFQLAQFIKNSKNKGKLMQSGLWAYTRHPNYFGEVTMWWGIGVMAIFASGNLLSLLGPATITFLILKVSGIPLLEKKMEQNPDFAEYKKRVSVFLPLPQIK